MAGVHCAGRAERRRRVALPLPPRLLARSSLADKSVSCPGLGRTVNRHAAPAPGILAVGMTTGATIHTTNGLWLNIKPRQVAPPQQQQQHAAPGAAAPVVEAREMALAFTDPPAPQQAPSTQA